MIEIPSVFVFCLGLLAQSAGADGSAHPCEPILAGVVIARGVAEPRPAAIADGEQRRTFATKFTVTSDDPDGAFRILETTVRSWAANRTAMLGDERTAVAAALATHVEGTAARIEVPRLDLDLYVRSKFAQRDGQRTVTMWLDVPDRRKAYQRWRTEIELVPRENDAVDVVIERTVRRRGGGCVRATRFGGRPGLVDSILKDPRLRVRSGVMPLKPFPLTLRPADVTAFLDSVNDPVRTQPLLYVSRSTASRTSPVDVEVLAERLRGFATVVIEGTDESASGLPVTGKLQRPLGTRHVFDGAVGIFGPGGELRATYRPDRLIDPAVITDKLVSLATRAFR